MKKKNTFKTPSQDMADQFKKLETYNKITGLLLIVSIVLVIFAFAVVLGN